MPRSGHSLVMRSGKSSARAVTCPDDKAAQDRLCVDLSTTLPSIFHKSGAFMVASSKPFAVLSHRPQGGAMPSSHRWTKAFKHDTATEFRLTARTSRPNATVATLPTANYRETQGECVSCRPERRRAQRRSRAQVQVPLHNVVKWSEVRFITTRRPASSWGHLITVKMLSLSCQRRGTKASRPPVLAVIAGRQA